MWRLLMFGVMLLGSVSVWAADKDNSGYQLFLKLDSIKASDAAQKAHEKVYLNVLAYTEKLDKMQPNRHYTVPDLPLTWHAQALEKVKAVPVWHDTLAAGDAAEVVISLAERNRPPWWTDNLIGSLKLHVKDDNGVLKIDWRQHDFANSSPQAAGHIQKTYKKNSGQVHYRFKGDGWYYDLILSIEKQPLPKIIS